jgi:hypothetical protein
MQDHASLVPSSTRCNDDILMQLTIWYLMIIWCLTSPAQTCPMRLEAPCLPFCWQGTVLLTFSSCEEIGFGRTEHAYSPQMIREPRLHLHIEGRAHVCR